MVVDAGRVADPQMIPFLMNLVSELLHYTPYDNNNTQIQIHSNTDGQLIMVGRLDIKDKQIRDR